MKVLAILTAMVVVMWCGSASAEVRIIGGVLICDTIEQVEQSIQTQRPVEGCGVLRGQFPAEITHLEAYEHNHMKFLITQYDFLSPVPWGVQTQYGFWGAPVPIGEPT